jgi:uncharacterized membrane protein
LPGVDTGRLETFADGVMAVAATLLIFDVDNQVQAGTHDRLGHKLLSIWPSYVAYAVSFVTIGVIWANHHTFMNQIGRTNRTFLMLNVGFLLSVAFIPFPTRLVAEHIHDSELKPAALLYGITLTTLAFWFQATWFYAARGGRLLKADADPRIVRGITRSYIPGVPIYVVATLVALVSPIVSVCLFVAITVFYLLESSLFGGGASPGDEDQLDVPPAASVSPERRSA